MAQVLDHNQAGQINVWAGSGFSGTKHREKTPRGVRIYSIDQLNNLIILTFWQTEY